MMQRHDGQGWDFPGGKVEDGEDAITAAIRECAEETGYTPTGLVEFARRISDGVDYTTFIAHCAERPDIEINEEHVNYLWVRPEDTGDFVMHPGMYPVLMKVNGNELDVARLIRDGQLTSPQRFQNMSLFDIRITGTGMAYRSKGEEFVWRDASLYLNDEFLARCNGLPVIFEHPDDNILDSKEYAERSVGTVFLPYIKGDEVWAIAKIFDDETVSLLMNEQMSTSPAVVLSSKEQNMVNLDDGSKLLIEGEPCLLDHIAICSRGVWDKADNPRGINSEDVMAKETENQPEGGEIKLDALFSKLDAIADSVAKVNARMDAMEEGEKPSRMIADKKKADKADDDDDDAKADDEEEEEKKADAAMCDEDEDDKKADGEEDRHQAKIADELASLKTKIADMQRELPDSEKEEIADAQYKADSIAAALGDTAPRPMFGEFPKSYRARLLEKFKKHSPAWKDLDITKMARVDASILDIAEKQVYSDAMAAANMPSTYQPGMLREVKRRTDAGHTITEFRGDIGAAWSDFKATPKTAHLRPLQ